jgi:hypothetical protein
MNLEVEEGNNCHSFLAFAWKGWEKLRNHSGKVAAIQ